MTSMNDMPAELLSTILRLADPRVELNTEEDIVDSNTSGVQSKPGVDDLLPPYHFPYNLAGVCMVWRDVLSRYPEYWTELYVLVDATHPTHLSELALYLQYSKDLPIKLTVTRSPVSATSSSLHEENEMRTRSVIEMLRPHFPRCTLIIFDLHRGSALPSLSRDLAVRSSDLSTLVLSCDVDDAHPAADSGDADVDMQSSPHAKSSDQEKPSGSASALTRLELSGYTIMDAIKYSPSLFENETEEMNITLSTYNLTTDLERQQSEQITETFFRALDIPGPNDKLTLENVDLPYTGDQIYFSVNSKGYLHLLNLGSEMTKNILMQVDFEKSFRLTIENCDLDNDDCTPFPYEIQLDLIDLDSSIDLCRFLKHYSIGILAVSNCPSFNDDAIRHLARRRDTQEGFLEYLEITDCPHVSVAALRELAGSGDPTFVKMESISVCAADPLATAQEMEALEEEFPDVFRWITIEGEQRSTEAEVI